MIAEKRLPVHPMPAPRFQYRILYVGRNLGLFAFLKARLRGKNCLLIYCPAGWLARALLQGNVYYSLLLFDDLSDTTGAELAQLARSLPNRGLTPIILVKGGLERAGTGAC